MRLTPLDRERLRPRFLRFMFGTLVGMVILILAGFGGTTLFVTYLVMLFVTSAGINAIQSATIRRQSAEIKSLTDLRLRPSGVLARSIKDGSIREIAGTVYGSEEAALFAQYARSGRRDEHARAVRERDHDGKARDMINAHDFAGLSPVAQLRIGHAERERTLAELGHHYGEGRLTADEFETRATAVAGCIVAQDLIALVKDLPLWSGE